MGGKPTVVSCRCCFMRSQKYPSALALAWEPCGEGGGSGGGLVTSGVAGGLLGRPAKFMLLMDGWMEVDEFGGKNRRRRLRKEAPEKGTHHQLILIFINHFHQSDEKGSADQEEVCPLIR